MQPSTLRNAQNFLHSPRLVEQLLNLTSITADDTVYEIGPGKGIITALLARRCKRVIAVERDERLHTHLRLKFAEAERIDIRLGDFLASPLPRLGYKVFSNIPFDQTTAIVQKLSAPATAPQAAYLVMQREAAGRFMGEPAETLRSVLLKPWFDLRILHTFRRSDFAPIPAVDAVLLGMEKREQPLVSSSELRLFRDFVIHAFTAHQPTLASTLKRIFTYPQMLRLHRCIPAGALPSQVALEGWLELFRIFQEDGNPQAKARILGSEQRLLRQQGRLRKIHRTRR